jgi:hypothetical protein
MCVLHTETSPPWSVFRRRRAQPAYAVRLAFTSEQHWEAMFDGSFWVVLKTGRTAAITRTRSFWLQRPSRTSASMWDGAPIRWDSPVAAGRLVAFSSTIRPKPGHGCIPMDRPSVGGRRYLADEGGRSTLSALLSPRHHDRDALAGHHARKRAETRGREKYWMR